MSLPPPPPPPTRFSPPRPPTEIHFPCKINKITGTDITHTRVSGRDIYKIKVKYTYKFLFFKERVTEGYCWNYSYRENKWPTEFSNMEDAKNTLKHKLDNIDEHDVCRVMFFARPLRTNKTEITYEDIKDD